MPKKKKKKPFNLFAKIRSALRDIFRYSPMHKAALDTVEWIKRPDGSTEFYCPQCNKYRVKEMARVDHIPPCGQLLTMSDLGPFANTLFYGTTRVLCKPCHDKVTEEQRRAKCGK